MADVSLPLVALTLFSGAPSVLDYAEIIGDEGLDAIADGWDAVADWYEKDLRKRAAKAPIWDTVPEEFLVGYVEGDEIVLGASEDLDDVEFGTPFLDPSLLIHKTMLNGKVPAERVLDRALNFAGGVE